MQYIYSAIFTPIEDGSGYYARIPDLPGCITTGSSIQDAIDQITDAASGWLVVAEDEGLEISNSTPQQNIPVEQGEYYFIPFNDGHKMRSKECFTPCMDGVNGRQIWD